MTKKSKSLNKMVAKEHMMEHSKNKSSKEKMMEKKISKMMGRKYVGKR